MKKRILFTPFTSSSIAHIVRCFSIAEELIKRGHEVYFTSCEKKALFISQNKFNVVGTYNEININDPKDQSPNFLITYKEKFINWFNTDIASAKKIKADLIISAPAIFGPYVYYATKIPTITIMDIQYFGDHSLGLMGTCKAKNNMYHKILRKILKPIFDQKFTKTYLKEINRIYKAINIKHDFKTRKELYAPMSAIIPSDDITEPSDKLRPNSIYCGPIFWNGFENMKTDLTDEKIIKFKNNSKLIYITFGGSVFDFEKYKKIFKILKSFNHKFIISLGPNFNRKMFPNDTQSLLIRNFVPGLRVSKHSDLVVNTGSQGSVMQGLWYGKPQVTFPTIMDQAFYANRLEELKLGINANPINILKFSKRESFANFPNNFEKNIINAIEKILEDDVYYINAQKFMKYLWKFKNPEKKSANFIEQYL